MTTTQQATPRTRHLPSWLVPTALTICVLGVLTAAYLTYEHFTGSTTLACPATETVNCAKVTSSAWSSILGVPVAPLGLVFFVGMLALCWPSVMRRDSRVLDLARIGFCVVGLLTAIYLLWAELFQIHAICLWCTVVHLLTFLLFAVLLIGRVLTEPEA